MTRANTLQQPLVFQHEHVSPADYITKQKNFRHKVHFFLRDCNCLGNRNAWTFLQAKEKKEILGWCTDTVKSKSLTITFKSRFLSPKASKRLIFFRSQFFRRSIKLNVLFWQRTTQGHRWMTGSILWSWDDSTVAAKQGCQRRSKKASKVQNSSTGQW